MASTGRQSHRSQLEDGHRAEPTPWMADRNEGLVRGPRCAYAASRGRGSRRVDRRADLGDVVADRSRRRSSISRRTTDAPWITPSAIRLAWYACSASDTPTPTSTGTSVIALTRAASAVADAANCRPLARDAEQPDRVDEPAGAGGDARQPLVGRGRRGEHHRLDPFVVGRPRTTAPTPRAAGRAGCSRRRRPRPAGARIVGARRGGRGCSRSSRRAGSSTSSSGTASSTDSGRRPARRAPPARPAGSPARPSPDRRTGCRSRSRRRRSRPRRGSRPPSPGSRR